MAVGTGIFKTPVGQGYNPAPSIERAANKTLGIITGAIDRKREDIKEEEAAFGQMYSNLGEIESRMQENYAGINQEMVDSTREFMKNHYKKGGRSTDPDFVSTLGQMTGRIKAGASNADRNREMLKQSAELIKSDPAIVDKATALSGLYQKMQDPDFLISQNQFNPEDYLSQYVNPNKVWESVVKALPTTGEKGGQYTDADGNLRSKTILMNPLINEAAPIGEDGRVNLNITPDFAKEVMSGAYGPRVIDQVLRVANEKYSNLPTDIAMQMAIKDGLSGSMGVSMSDKVIKNARDIELENRRMARQDTMTDLAISRELRAAGKVVEADELENRFQEFSTAASSGNKGFLGEYENQKAGIKDFQWVNADEKYKAEKDLAAKLATKSGWDAMSRDERLKAIEDLGVSDQIPAALGGIGRYDTKSDEAYSAVKSKMDEVASQLPSGISGLSYKMKTGTKDGEAIYEEVEIPVSNQDEMINAFRTLENLRRTGKSMKPVTKVDAPDEVDLTQKDYWK